MPPGSDKRIIACEVLRYELESLGVQPDEAIFLKQGLHRTPEKLRATIQENIDQLEAGGFRGRIILGYGLCGNGIAGLKARYCDLVFPGANDCIDLLLGSCRARQEDTLKGYAYYFSPGWVAFSENSYTEYRRCLSLYGEETARWVIGEMLKAYKRVTYIDTGLQSGEEDRQFVRLFATTFNLIPDEIKGSLEWLARLLHGEGDDVIKIAPGTVIETDRLGLAGNILRQ